MSQSLSLPAKAKVLGRNALRAKMLIRVRARPRGGPHGAMLAAPMMLRAHLQWQQQPQLGISSRTQTRPTRIAASCLMFKKPPLMTQKGWQKLHQHLPEGLPFGRAPERKLKGSRRSQRCVVNRQDRNRLLRPILLLLVHQLEDEPGLAVCAVVT